MDKKLIIPVQKNKRASINDSLRKLFLIDKLNSPAGYAFLLILLALLGAGIVKFGIIFALLTLAAVIGIPVVYTIVAYPRIGVFVYLFLAYMIMWFFKLGVDFPLGTLMDGMEGLFILSIFINQKKKKDWSTFKGPISTMILLWIGYNVIEVANPTAETRMTWLYAIRAVALVSLTYFIFLYYISTKEYIKLIFKLWIALAVFGALYGLKQEYIGFFGFEDNYLHSNPQVELLLFIGGVWRKFSIFSDPVAFSYNMVTASMLCIGLMTGPISNIKRFLLLMFVVLFIMGMLYSGTRGAYVLIPVAMIMLAILKYSKKVLLMVILMGVFVVALIYVPTSNGTLNRFQSAFRPSDDPSYNVRTMNQKRIKPFILSHPIGGGLGATETFGQKFAPNSYLAHFAPDSGYVRVAVELGYVGLFIFCILMFTILKTGINNYYRIQDPELKSYCLAAVLVVFALNFGNIPQEAIVQYPSNVYFYLATSIMVVTLRLDQQKNILIHPVDKF